MSIALGHCLTPSYFVSYSRRQEAVARLLTDVIAGSARAVWYDRDSIVVGDAWFEEIRRGIGAADELVLILSDDSIASEAVEKEVRLALDGGKLIRPIAVTALSRDLPEILRAIQYLDLSSETAPDELRRRLSAYFGDPGRHARPDEKLKLFACRSVCPRFCEAFVSANGQFDAQDFAAQLEGLAAHYSHASTIQLNAGLMLCVAGKWDNGVALLRRYAHAANNLAGWYFLALHLPRREGVLAAPARIVTEALDAIGRALNSGSNPLALLAAAILETGGANLGSANLFRRLEQFAAAEPGCHDPPEEYLRAYWCLKPSFRVLGAYQGRVEACIKEIAA